MKTEVVDIKIPKDTNIIIGQSHFIKTVEDLYEQINESSPYIKFGISFCEASNERLIRSDGNDEELILSTNEIASDISSGHCFVILIKNAYPINILNRIKNVSEVCKIYVATANPLQIIIAETNLGRGILGVIDGEIPLGIENGENKKQRKDFLENIGYKR